MPKNTRKSRNYTREQVQRIMAHQNHRNALSTALALATGIRAHELLTLRTASEGPMVESSCYSATLRDGLRYTVIGTGDLVREVSIPHELAQQVESRRLGVPIERIDRGTAYEVIYDLAGGQAWSASFSVASKRAIGFSNGAHGLRHSYVQERNYELQCLLGDKAQLVLSKELGYLRPVSVDTYLR